MCPHLGRGLPHEEIASLCAAISAIDGVEVMKRLQASSNLYGRGNGYGSIDDRFGVELGHRGAPYVLDIQDVAPNVLLKEASLLRESVSPTWLVRDDLHGTFCEADHVSSLEPADGNTAHPTYRQPADLRRDSAVSGTVDTSHYPGLRLARTLCV
jgi:hypothetical protein